ncbi:MAG: site-2 protease family protein [Clostridia bacterium]|nr:site-2 protease family protein [Clostridia bacterium]MBQ7788132.1 site-2 protease family protein [Clostridia bacterium]
MIVLYIILAILVFGFMIMIHELGHFLFAKKFGVTIEEFSIGMGPKILSKKGKDGVVYSLRALPLGGYVAMVGETEDSEDPNAFNRKPAWQRFIIVIAGAIMNLLVGIIIMIILTICSSNFGSTVIGEFNDNSISDEYGLQVGDEIIEVAGTSVHTYDELSYEIMRSGYEPIDVTVIRNGEKRTFNVTFPQMVSQNVVFGSMDFRVYGEDKTFSTVVKNAFFSIKSTIKMIWDSIFDLLSGRYGIEQVSGPIGVTGAITQAAQFGAQSFFYMVVVISINLGVFNLLPIPALDGGTLVFLIIEMIAKKPVPRKIEERIKLVGFALLMLLVIFVTFKDIFSLFS